MDALALLCTLHADGPATLKRLRAAGCPDLTRLLARPVTEVAVALDVPPAAARRLLREARLLAERVGPDLEDEEAPSVASVAASGPVAGPAATAGPAPLRVEVPPVPQATVLDQGDRALLERIVREGRAAREAAPGAVAAGSTAEAAPVPAPAPVPFSSAGADAARAGLPAPFGQAAEAALAGPESPLERLGVDLGAEAPWHGEPPAGFLGSLGSLASPGSPGGDGELAAAAEAPAGTVPGAPGVPTAVDALVALGLEAALARDLERLGIDSVAALAEVDALALRRDLDVTFAEAKRLVFLAKRALREAGSKAPALQARAAERPLDRPAERTVELRATARPESPRAAGAQAALPEPGGTRPAAAASLAPVPAEPAAEPAPELTPEPAPEPASALPASAPRAPWRLTPRTEPLPPAPEPEPVAAVPARPRFWEPRAHLSAAAQESQGIQVDPSEVTRPRRFWEARRDAGSSAAGGPQGAEGTGAAPAGSPSRSASPVGPAGTTSGTTLGWNFEIPRPELPPPSGPSRRTWRPAEPSDDSSAGPFA